MMSQRKRASYQGQRIVCAFDFSALENNFSFVVKTRAIVSESGGNKRMQVWSAENFTAQRIGFQVCLRGRVWQTALPQRFSQRELRFRKIRIDRQRLFQ